MPTGKPNVVKAALRCSILEISKRFKIPVSDARFHLVQALRNPGVQEIVNAAISNQLQRHRGIVDSLEKNK